MALLINVNLLTISSWWEQTGWLRIQKLALVVMTCLIVLGAVSLVSKAVRKAVDDGNEGVTSDAERRAETLGSVLKNTARIIVAVIFLLALLQEFGVNIQPLLAGSAVAGVALGFGAQALVKDVISGFFLLLENQFGVGDIISLDDKHIGTVERMTLRITQLRDIEGRAHYVPNGSINRVVVMSKEFAKALVEVEVGQIEDIERVMEVLRTIGKELHQAIPTMALEPTEVKGVEALNLGNCTIRTLTKTSPGSQWDVARELRRRILIRFREEGIPWALPQRVVWNRGDALAGPANSEANGAE